MRRYILLISILAALTANLVLLSDTGAAGIQRAKIAVLPFNDLSSQYINLAIPEVLQAELTRFEFIDTTPVETTNKILQDIKPSVLWTGDKTGDYGSGILWKIEEKTLTEVISRLSSDYVIYGSLTRFGSRWRVDAYIKAVGKKRPEWSFTSTGIKDEKIPGGIKEIAEQIADWLNREMALSRAEEFVKDHLAGIHTYSSTLEGIKGLANTFPDSLSLSGLLLDLYLTNKLQNREEILQVGSRLINLYPSSNEEEKRYLLSLDIDPFEIVAETYEVEKEWAASIDVRKNALRLYPYKVERHKEALGRDYYNYARSLERSGKNNTAKAHFKNALLYLKPASEEYAAAIKALER